MLSSQLFAQQCIIPIRSMLTITICTMGYRSRYTNTLQSRRYGCICVCSCVGSEYLNGREMRTESILGWITVTTSVFLAVVPKQVPPTLSLHNSTPSFTLSLSTPHRFHCQAYSLAPASFLATCILLPWQDGRCEQSKTKCRQGTPWKIFHRGSAAVHTRTP